MTTVKTTTKIATVLVSVFALTACQNIKSMMAKRNNGSLDYTTAQKLPPIQLPASQAGTLFVPLYEVPEVSSQSAATTNATGTQYQLPQPPKVVR